MGDEEADKESEFASVAKYELVEHFVANDDDDCNICHCERVGFLMEIAVTQVQNIVFSFCIRVKWHGHSVSNAGWC